MAVYWVAALFMISSVVKSLGYTFVESLFMASFFLPGMLLALYLHHRMRLDASRVPLDMVYVGLAVIVFRGTLDERRVSGFGALVGHA